ncbi:helix-turn-helix domain-containing protein [Streptomyces sp. NBC_01198]|uniref:helix-turn-helix domain-containing protein n=1 Tax=Streptomyces sp. NBC_01198 TaxID=2903769 RepID=UPI002E11FCC9|nr:helix-turn-helix domain-containing protein [Streptomyces sp. NBC_01198]
MPARSHLAPVLTQLHRASGIPLRSLAARLGLPAADTATILSGECFPGWSLTERFAQVCGADPLVLRKVWEDARLRAAPHRHLD